MKLPGMFDTGEGIVNQWWSLRFTFAAGLSRVLGATLFPPRCCLCGSSGTPPALDLCQWCSELLPWHAKDEPGGLSALRFEWPADVMIRELKYRANTAHAPVLAEILARAVSKRGFALPRLLLPVPQHAERWRARGLDHAMVITRHLGIRLRIPFTGRAMRRVRNTPSQTGLDRSKRVANVSGAFEIRGPDALRQLRARGHVAVIDDVATTGSTLQEMRRVLQAAGVPRVDLWSVARA